MLAALLASISVSSAATAIVSSYPVRSEGSSFGFSSSSWEAFGFTMGTGPSYEVESITMRLSGQVEGRVSVAIYSSTSRTYTCGWTPGGFCSYEAPNVSLGNVGTQLVGLEADYTFATQSGPELQGNTRYWVVFQGIDPGIFRYYEHSYSDVPYTGDPGHGFSPWQGLYSSEAGATPFGFAKSPGYDQNPASGVFIPGILGQDWSYHSGLNVMNISGSAIAVPEPVSIWLAIAALLGVLVGPRRTTRATAALN